MTIEDSRDPERKLLFERIEARAHAGTTLEAAAQACAEGIYAHFRESLVLVRICATLPYARLPQEVRQAAREIVEAKGAAPSLLQPGSLILTLLGTAGELPEWNERRRSRGHLGMPLVSAAFVGNLPMTSALMRDIGLGLDWLDRPDGSVVVRDIGQSARVFFVPDARTAEDAQGRKVVPDSRFVDDHGVRTVFGLGGGYLDGTLLVMLFFSRELLERRQVEALLPAVDAFKAGTASRVREQKIFG